MTKLLFIVIVGIVMISNVKSSPEQIIEVNESTTSSSETEIKDLLTIKVLTVLGFILEVVILVMWKYKQIKKAVRKCLSYFPYSCNLTCQRRNRVVMHQANNEPIAINMED